MCFTALTLTADSLMDVFFMHWIYAGLPYMICQFWLFTITGQRKLIINQQKLCVLGSKMATCVSHERDSYNSINQTTYESYV